jgi:hypothetical protein
MKFLFIIVAVYQCHSFFVIHVVFFIIILGNDRILLFLIIINNYI